MPPTLPLLTRLAAKYVWWRSAEEALAMPERIVAQTMNIGSFDDVQALAQELGDEYLRGVLNRAEIGQFSQRSWAYWHYRLGLASTRKTPPMPTRLLG